MMVVPALRFSQQRVQNNGKQRQQDEIEKCTFGYHNHLRLEGQYDSPIKLKRKAGATRDIVRTSSSVVNPE